MNILVLEKAALRFVPALLIFGFIGYLSLRSIDQQAENSKWIAHTHEVRNTLDDILVDVLTIESGTRGYVATGEEPFFNSFKSAAKHIDERIEVLAKQTEDNAAQLDRIKVLREQIREKRKFNLDLIHLRKDANDAPGAINKLATGNGKVLLNAVQKTITEMLGAEDQLLLDRTAALTISVHESKRYIIGGAVLAFLVLGIAILTIHRDIVKRKRAEAELDRFFHLSIDMLCVVSFDGRFTRVNPAFEKTLGYPVGEIKNRLFSEIMHPDDLKAAFAEMEKLKGGQLTVNFENRFRCLDGTYKWLEWMAIPYPKENVIYATARDTTERRRARQALLAALSVMESGRNRLDAMIQAVSSGLLVVDLEGRIVLINTVAEQLLGATREEIVGRKLDTAIASDVLRGRLELAIGNREAGDKFDFTSTKSDGSTEQVLHAGLSVIRDSKGDASGVIAVFEDVTKEREVDRMKTDFLATAAHELRTPLTSIRGFSELLLTRQIAPEKQRTILQTVNTQATNLANIINDLLDLARIESGRGLVLKRSPTDLVAIAKTVVEIFETRGVPHKFHVESEGARKLAFCDPSKIQQVFQNLLSNAVKYSPDGGDIRVVFKLDAGLVHCTVSDQGIGMSPDQRARIFTKFFRVDASNNAAEGTGLGMSIVKAIIEQHGGTVEVESEMGRGTSVTFTLRQHGLGAPHSVSKPASIIPGRKRILILEDDDAVVSMMQFFLEHEKYEAFASNSGKDFIELAAELKPDLICLDCLLPDADGFDISAALKQDPRTQNIPFIFVSVRESERERGLACGAKAFVAKPFNQHDLITSVRMALNDNRLSPSPLRNQNW